MERRPNPEAVASMRAAVRNNRPVRIPAATFFLLLTLVISWLLYTGRIYWRNGTIPRAIVQSLTGSGPPGATTKAALKPAPTTKGPNPSQGGPR